LPQLAKKHKMDVMKRFFVIPFLLFFFLLFPSVVNAQITRTSTTAVGDTVIIHRDEVIEGDFFIAGETVEFSGTINGDLYIVGNQISVSGQVDGDLLAAGGEISITGVITQNVRAAGAQITIKGSVGRNISLAGVNINSSDSSYVAGSLSGVAGNISLDGPVGGDVNATGGSFEIKNTIKGNVEVNTGHLKLAPGAEILGNLNYRSDNEAEISDKASVAGKTSRHSPGNGAVEGAKYNLEKIIGGWTKTGRVFSFFALLLMGLILIRLFPSFFKSSLDILNKSPLKSLGIGFAGAFIFPFIIIVLFITFIGIPVALALFVFYVFALYISKAFIILWTGIFLFEKTNQKAGLGWAFVLGLIVYSVIVTLPVLGGILTFLATITGFGILLVNTKRTYLSARKKTLI